MKILDKLKNIVDIRNDINISGIKLSNLLRLFHNENNSITYNGPIHIDNRTVVIDYKSLPSDQKALVIDALKKAEPGTLITTEDNYNRITDVQVFIENMTDNEILDFYRGKISSENHAILTRALYIRYLHDQERSKEIMAIKSQLTGVYGEKANTIANLCTAGYFEGFLKKRYEELSINPSFKPQDFATLFDSLISDFPIAVFVSQNMSKAEIEDKIKAKVKLVKDNKLDYMNIHGLGPQNIKTIESLVEEIDSLLPTVVGKLIEKTENTIILRLRFSYE